MNPSFSRRRFIQIISAGAAATSLPVWAASPSNPIIHATAITEVMGDGARLSRILLEYTRPLKYAPAATEFTVDGRTVTAATISDSAGNTVPQGRFVLLTLSPDDAVSPLKKMIPMSNGTTTGKGGAHWKAGDKPHDNLVFDPPQTIIRTHGQTLSTQTVRHAVADQFQQHTYHDKPTGRSLRYNLFVPPSSGSHALPLVLFMHDAGATSEFHTATLLQGLGAVVWAKPEEQAKRPCFVLAPQYDEIIVDDRSQASSMLEITIRLIRSLQRQYRIDSRRLYATGQSGGCMMAMAMNIRYPELFAASYLVAGKWNADLVAPMAKQKLWFMASADDKGAFPSMNSISRKLEQSGQTVARAWWNAQWHSDEYRYAADALLAQKPSILYTVYRQGSVFTEGESRAGASGHRNTWKYAYSIEPIREWLFAQRRIQAA